MPPTAFNFISQLLSAGFHATHHHSMDDCGLNSPFHCKVAVLALQDKKPKFFYSIQGPKIKCQSSTLYSELEDNCFWSFSQSFSIIISPAWHHCKETHHHFSWSPQPQALTKYGKTTWAHTSTTSASHRCCLESPAILLLPGLKHPSHYRQDSNKLSFSELCFTSEKLPPIPQFCTKEYTQTGL